MGSVRGYFHLDGGELSWANWMEAMLAGRGFVTNGPLIAFTANGGMPGAEIALPAGGGPVTFQATVNSIASLEQVELVSMGTVVHSATLAEGRQLAAFDVAIPVTRSGWYSVRAIGPERTYPVENTRPLAVTNPVYVIVGGQPIRDRASAEYFMKWIDVLTEMARAHPGWRSDKERAHVLGQFAEARAIYEQRAREAQD